MKKLIVANWKMYLTLSQSVTLTKRISKSQITNHKLRVVLCPSFVALEEVGKIVHGTRVKLGAQDVEPEKRGAFTGEVGLDDLASLQVEYVLVGHSERRRIFHETDALVNEKLRAVIKAGMRPILCVGEPHGVRTQGMAKVRRYVGTQVKTGLRGVAKKDLRRTVIAYEPIWAIGSGKSDMPEDAVQMHAWIRKVVGIKSVRILYGGSVSAKNARAFLRAPGIDGLLIGKASVNLGQWRAITHL
ncbi:triose-phosphate isomerase [Candidatus Uhrbacteria bacterium]|nr:triose-phosphate isomerase [Candidatus Uhrbacteria bacterium]